VAGVGAALEPLFDGALFPHAVRNRPANSNAKHVFTAQIIPRPTKEGFPQCNLLLLLAQGLQDWLLHVDWRMQACTSLFLEARDRLGGRVHTIHDPRLTIPIELGADFIHGVPEEIRDILRGENRMMGRWRAMTGVQKSASSRNATLCSSPGKRRIVMERPERCMEQLRQDIGRQKNY